MKFIPLNKELIDDYIKKLEESEKKLQEELKQGMKQNG